MDLTDDDAKHFGLFFGSMISFAIGLGLMGKAVTNNQNVIKEMKDRQDVKKIDEIGWTWFWVGFSWIILGTVGTFFLFGRMGAAIYAFKKQIIELNSKKTDGNV